VDPAVRAHHAENPDESPGIVADLKPMPGALGAFSKMSAVYHTYILSTAPWKNPGAWQDKLDRVQKHLGDVVFKRLIIIPDHHLSKGDYLMDDKPCSDVNFFEGTHIQLGSSGYPDRASVLRKLVPLYQRGSAHPSRRGDDLLDEGHRGFVPAFPDDARQQCGGIEGDVCPVAVHQAHHQGRAEERPELGSIGQAEAGGMVRVAKVIADQHRVVFIQVHGIDADGSEQVGHVLCLRVHKGHGA